MRYAISFPMIQTTAAQTASGPIGDSNTPYWKLRRRVGPKQPRQIAFNTSFVTVAVCELPSAKKRRGK
jgi:hypothetical protein